LDYIAAVPFIPFCPEQLGGLPTPRPPANIEGGDGYDVLAGKARLLDATGKDVTDSFRKGAKEAYSLARLCGSSLAIMKSKSPSCGIKTPHCETETGMGPGVTAAFFMSQGIRVFELDRDDPFPVNEFFELLDGSIA